MVHCCVPLCKSNYRKNPELSYHEFPANNDMKSAWLKAISRKNFQPNDKSNSSRVCSKHFKEDDYIPNTKYRLLKRASIPSIFPSSLSNHMEVEDEDAPRKSGKQQLDNWSYPSKIKDYPDLSNANMDDAKLLLNFFETVSRTVDVGIGPICADAENLCSTENT